MRISSECSLHSLSFSPFLRSITAIDIVLSTGEKGKERKTSLHSPKKKKRKTCRAGKKPKHAAVSTHIAIPCSAPFSKNLEDFPPGTFLLWRAKGWHAGNCFICRLFCFSFLPDMGRDSQKCPPRPRICSPFPSFSFLSYEGFFCRLSPPPPRYVILRRKVATKQRGTRRRRGIKRKTEEEGGRRVQQQAAIATKKHPPPTRNGFPTSSPKITGERKYTGFRSRRRRRYIHYSCSTCLTHKREQSPPPPLSTEQQRGENRYRVREGGPLHFCHLVFPRISQKKSIASKSLENWCRCDSG